MLYDPQTAEPQPTSPLLESLIKMRQFLSDPQNWTKGNFRNDSNQCCILGAYGIVHDMKSMGSADYMFRVLHKHQAREVVAALYSVLRPERPIASLSEKIASVWIYNDGLDRTHEDVLQLLDKAIQAEATTLREKETVNAI